MGLFFLGLLLLVVSDSILLLLLFGHDSVALAGILQRVTSTHLCGHKKKQTVLLCNLHDTPNGLHSKIF